MAILTQARLIAAGITLATGFGLGIAYDRIAPWAIGPRLERLQESLPRRDAERYSAGAAAQRVEDERVVQTQWRPALELCRAERWRQSATAAQTIDTEKSAARSASDAAYRLGRASCRGDVSAPVGSSVSSTAGVVQSGEELRSIVTGSLGTTP